MSVSGTASQIRAILRLVEMNAERCRSCNGSGECARCGGAGTELLSKCVTCMGSGVCPVCDGKSLRGVPISLFPPEDHRLRPMLQIVLNKVQAAVLELVVITAGFFILYRVPRIPPLLAYFLIVLGGSFLYLSWRVPPDRPRE